MRTAKTLIGWADAQADLNLRWANMPFCWFCCEAAHMLKMSSGFPQSFSEHSKRYINL